MIIRPLATLINISIVCCTTIAYADEPISKSKQAAPGQAKQAGSEEKAHRALSKTGPSQVKIADINAAGIAIIDAGSKDGVQVGDKFICSSLKPSNEPVYRLIVKKTLEHSSEASIETTWGNLIERATHSPKGKFAYRYDGVDLNHEKDGGGQISKPAGFHHEKSRKMIDSPRKEQSILVGIQQLAWRFRYTKVYS